MNLITLILFSLGFTALAQTNADRLSQVKELKRLAFGSCNFQNVRQPLWTDMLRQSPDLFIWGGDIIYADWDSKNLPEEAFKKQFNQPDYVKLREITPVIGTWDDHDFGLDNADGTLPTKALSQQQVLDFLEEPYDSIRRIREGIYTSYTFGEVPRKIKIILLDNRYFKNLEPDAPLLGKTQWAWLENEFKDSDASLHFVVAGLSIFSPLLPYSEEWGHHPVEVERMLDLVKKYSPKGLIFLTGDRHFASIFTRFGQLEFLSSGMTHVVSPRTWRYISRYYPKTYFGLNYGQVDVDWEESDPRLTLAIRGVAGRDIHRSQYLWKDGKWKPLN